MAARVILCFHRVLPEGSDGAWPYFLRGTAVTPECLRAQLVALRAHGTFVDPADPFGPVRDGAGERPRFWLTFDDGYLDTLRHARPVLDAVGVRASVFVTTEAALGRITLPADRWYAAVTSAQRTHGVVRTGGTPFQADLRSHEGRGRLANSPERRAFLEAGVDQRDETLWALCAALGGSSTPRERLYLDRSELDGLRRAGWCIGGHGATHALLPQLSPLELQRELSDMDAGLRRLGVMSPTMFAYPDGQHSEYVRDALRARGCPAALTLGDAVADAASDRLTLPRFIVPNEPDWVERVLVPRLKEVA
jgi:peptidoglycan/xylan/chitin deacetylase (PgdA/CDA1 family)